MDGRADYLLFKKWIARGDVTRFELMEQCQCRLGPRIGKKTGMDLYHLSLSD